MPRTSLAFVICMLIAMGVGVILGAFLSGRQTPPHEPRTDVPSVAPDGQRDLEVARRQLEDQERLIEDLQRRTRREGPKLEDGKGPTAGTAEVTDDPDAIPLPGEAAGQANFNANPGERDWRWSPGTILPDKGQASTKPYTVSVIVQPENGTISIALFGSHDKDSLRVSGLVAIRVGGGDRWKVISRTEGASEGLTLTAPGGVGAGAAGAAGSLLRAHDLVSAWQEVARANRGPTGIPAVVGCNNLRFRVDGVVYTLTTYVEYGSDGQPVAVTFRDGR